MSTKKRGAKRKADAISSVDEESPDLAKQKKQKLNPTVEENTKMEENIADNDNTNEVTVDNVELPPEILVSIFSQLENEDLSRASCVCQHWWLCSKDETLAWFTLPPLEFVEQTENYFSLGSFDRLRVTLNDVRQALCKGKPEDLRRMVSFGTLPRSELNAGKSLCKLLDKNDDLIAVIGGFISFPDLDETQDYFRIRLATASKLKNTGAKPRPKSPHSEVHILIVEANYRKIENILRSGEEFKGANILLHDTVHTFLNQFYRWPVNYLQTLCDLKKPYTPTVLPTITEQPFQLTGVKMHNYQIGAVNWMVNTEQDSEKDYEVSPLVPVIKGSGILAKIDLEEQKLVLVENAHQYNVKLKAKGGILADEMGLGKTIEVLGLILSNPMKQAPKNGSFFATKATLIICPNHLLAQWASEIEKHTEPKLNVLQIPTMAQFKKFTYQQILDADVVLVTANMLKNKNYIAYPLEPHQIKFGEDSPHERVDRMDALLEERKDKAPEKLKGVILDHFHWHRIVLDEGHETVVDDFIMNVVNYMQSTYKWYVSGTPFPKVQIFKKIRKFLGLATPEAPSLTNSKLPNLLRGAYSHARNAYTFESYVNETLDRLLIDNLFWRNTKESIKEEYKMVDTKQELVLLEFTPIEAAIYEDLSIKYKHRNISQSNPLRQLCCKLDYDWGNTLEDMRVFMCEQKKKDIEQAKENIKWLKKQKKESKQKLTQPILRDWERRTCETNIREYPKNLVAREHDLSEHKRVQTIFDEIKPRDTSKFEHNSKDFLIEHYGTKLANLVLYLKNLFEKEPTTRVIVFSQFTAYLDMIGALLAENDISTSSVEGNVYKKTKALKQFKDEGSEVKVILLSLSKAASGTNLIEASHVLLMDPLTGSKEEAQAYENQAVGRAQRQGQTKPVTVVRFIIKNTIEHEYYIRNTGSNQHGQVTLSRSNSKLVRSSSFGTLLANQ